MMLQNAYYRAWHMVSEWVKITQSCPTPWDPVDCSLPGSFVHGILQARILEWVATSEDLPDPRDWTRVSCTAGKFFTVWVSQAAPWHMVLILNKWLPLWDVTDKPRSKTQVPGGPSRLLYMCEARACRGYWPEEFVSSMGFKCKS